MMAASFAPDARKRPEGGAIRRVRQVWRSEATGLTAAVYKQIAREFALVPPMTIHAAVPEILAGLWCLSREAFVVGRAGRAGREMVAAGISQTNRCPYCVEVHSAMLHATQDHDLARKLASADGTAKAASLGRLATGRTLPEWPL